MEITLKVCRFAFFVWTTPISNDRMEDFRLNPNDVIMYLSEYKIEGFWHALTKFGIVETNQPPNSQIFKK